MRSRALQIHRTMTQFVPNKRSGPGDGPHRPRRGQLARDATACQDPSVSPEKSLSGRASPGRAARPKICQRTRSSLSQQDARQNLACPSGPARPCPGSRALGGATNGRGRSQGRRILRGTCSQTVNQRLSVRTRDPVSTSTGHVQCHDFAAAASSLSRDRRGSPGAVLFLEW